MSKKIKNEKGQAMVEFALVLPILLLFIAGVIDFGWIFHNQLAANNASREAARYVAIHYKIPGDEIYENTSQAAIVAKSKIISSVPTIENIAVSVNHSYEIVTDLDGGEYITVDVSGDVIVLTPVLSTILGEKYKINSLSTMRVEK